MSEMPDRPAVNSTRSAPTQPLDEWLYTASVGVLRIAVAARGQSLPDLCETLQDLACALDQLGDEQADICAGNDRLAAAIAFGADRPWGGAV